MRGADGRGLSARPRERQSTMTAHKHLKERIRSRMTKTGERYSTARRVVIRQAEAPPPAGPARWHLPGSIPAATALRILLSAAGVRDPRTKKPLAETMVFGIAGGIGVGVAAFYYEKEDFASFFIAGRHLWQDDAAYLVAALARFGIEPMVRETAGEKGAEKHLREALSDGRPCIAWVDMANLPHRAMPAFWSGGGYHVITVYSIDDARKSALIGDLTDEPIEIALSDLAVARGRIKKFKNRVMTIPAGESPKPLSGMVRSGLGACHHGLLGKPVKGYPATFNLDAFKLLARRMHGSTEKESWGRVFPRGHRLWQALTSMHEFIENYHTGGGLCRPIFAEFLAEAADILGDGRLKPLADLYAELGRGWSALAEAALPDGVPLFRKARKLFAERADLISAGDPSRLDELRAAWKREAELQAEARSCFPLSESQCDGLLADLAQRVMALHEGEVAAHAALGEIVEEKPSSR